LDNCFEGDEPNQLAQRVLELAGNTYAEVSPSGKGLHIFGIGKLEKALKPVHGKFEVYSHGRFSTVTEEGVENGGLLGDIQPAIDYLQGLDNEQRKRSPSNTNNLTIIKGSRNNSLHQEMCRFYMCEAKTKEDFTVGLKEQGLSYALEFVNANMSEPLETQEVQTVNHNAFNSCKERFDPNKKRQITEGTKKFRPRALHQHYIDLLINKFGEPKRDIIDGKMKVKTHQGWIVVTEKNGEVLREIATIASDSESTLSDHPVRYKASHDALLDHYVTHEQTLKGELLLEKADKWDGFDRIAEIAKHLSALHFTETQVIELIKDWMITTHRKIFNPKKYQNRALVLQGVTGIGKDEWEDFLTACYGPYVIEVIIKKGMGEDDWARYLSQAIILKIPEFDRITSGGNQVGNSSIKHLITARSHTLIPKFREGAVTKDSRASIMASINPKDINNDPTSARRYLAIELVGRPHDKALRDKALRAEEKPAINWGYSKDAKLKDTRQILAQLEHESKTWAGLSPDTLAALEEVQARLTPEDPIQACIEETFKKFWNSDRVGWKSQTERTLNIDGERVPCVFVSNTDINPFLKEAAESLGEKPKKIRERMNQYGYLHNTGQERGIWVPLLSAKGVRVDEQPKQSRQSLSRDFDGIDDFDTREEEIPF
jgi:hypothetical protein